MSHRRHARRLVPLVLAVAVAATGCGVSGGEETAPPTTVRAGATTTEAGGAPTTSEPDGGPDEPTTTEPGAEVDVAPEVADCWEAISETELEQPTFAGERVTCDEPHGGITVAVAQLVGDDVQVAEDALAPGGLGEATVADMDEIATRECAEAWEEGWAAATLDDDLPDEVEEAYRPTKLQATYWFPSPDQWEDDQRWIRCDLQTTDGTTFETPELEQLAGAPLPADLVGCSADPGPGPDVPYPVPCDSPDADFQLVAEFLLAEDLTPQDATGYDTLVFVTLPPVCETLATTAVGDVGGREVRLFAPPGFEEADGWFGCGVRVTPPVTDPLGS